MKVIGITGGVGAGKSAILKYIENQYRAKIVLADEVAHIVKEPGEVCYEPLIQLLGKDVLEETECENLVGQNLVSKNLTEPKTMGKELTSKELTSKELTSKELTSKELTCKDFTGNEIPRDDEAKLDIIGEDFTCKEVTDKEATDKEATDKDATDKEATGKVFTDRPRIDKKKMAEKIFSDKELLQKVNELIHPAVKKYIVEEIEKAKKEQDVEYFFVEAALLIEDHYDEIVEEMWYVDADPQIRRERLKETRGYSDEKVDAIMSKQLSREEFLIHCKVIINNSTTKEDAYRQIDEALAKV